jgi:hypothetical protein
MLVIDVADVTARRVGRHRDHWNARTGTEEIDRLDESRVVIAGLLLRRIWAPANQTDRNGDWARFLNRPAMAFSELNEFLEVVLSFARA